MLPRRLADIRDALDRAVFQPLVQVEFATPADARSAAAKLEALGVKAGASGCSVRFVLREVFK
jgi:hypothetical protein